MQGIGVGIPVGVHGNVRLMRSNLNDLLSESSLMTELASRPNLQQSHSPLANLVRRTSSRRIKGREQFHWQQPEPIAEYDSAPPNDGRNQQKKLYVEIKGTLSSSTLSPPHSPLLHTHFARDSVATASSFDDNSYLDARSGSFQDDHSDYDYRHFEDARDRNVYVEAGLPSLRDPWRSTDKHAAIFHNHSSSDDRPSQQEQYPQQVKNSSPSVPSVFISLHDPSIDNSVDTAAIRGGPIVKPVTNFSRPIRESGQLEHSSAMGERVTPQLPPDMREQKRKVLERNARRGMAKSSGESMKTRSPLSQTSMDALSIDGSSSGTPLLTPLNLMTLISILTGWNQNHGQQGRSSPSTKDLKPQLSPIISSPHPQSKSGETGIRTVSPDSLYSAYSYYEYEKAATYPSGSQTPTRTSVVKQPQRPPSSTSSNRSSLRSPEGLRTPQEYLQLGIQHHEANRLRESARCFERSATEEGGCGVGMLMYGLSLRHGWGCARNEKAGFKWLRKAAEHAVEDLERVRMNGDMDVRVIEVNLNDFILSHKQIY